MTGALLLASVIWGSGAVFMQVCIDGGIETGLQMFFRFWIGALCLGALVHKKLRQINRRLLLCGALCGTLLFFSFFILTLGLEFTTPANSAFLSASSVMLVPFISWIMLKIRPERKVFIGCFLCLLGVAVLSLQLGSGIYFTMGDSLTLLSAVFFSFTPALRQRFPADWMLLFLPLFNCWQRRSGQPLLCPSAGLIFR